MIYILAMLLILCLVLSISAGLYFLIGVDIEVITLGWNIVSFLGLCYLLFDICRFFSFL